MNEPTRIRVSEEDWVALYNGIPDPEDRQLVSDPEGWITLLVLTPNGKPLRISMDPLRTFQSKWYMEQEKIER